MIIHCNRLRMTNYVIIRFLLIEEILYGDFWGKSKRLGRICAFSLAQFTFESMSKNVRCEGTFASVPRPPFRLSPGELCYLRGKRHG